MLFAAHASIVLLGDLEQLVSAIGGKDLASLAQRLHIGLRHRLKAAGYPKILLEYVHGIHPANGRGNRKTHA